MNKKCPYCNTLIEESLSVCPNCNNDLSVECPYCKQTIKAYDTVCPYCSTVLKPKDNSKIFVTITIIINCLWIFGNILGLCLMVKFPQVFKLPEDKSIEVVARLAQLSISSLFIVAIPYIIAILKQFKTKLAITGLVINFILTIIFIFMVTLLYYIYA